MGVLWVDANKGDTAEPDYRSRLVTREFAVGRDDALYAATPPLEALGLLISHTVTIPVDGPKRKLVINDVHRAYFYAEFNRDCQVELPEKDSKRGSCMLGKLRLCLYGTRDAANSWQEPLSAHLAGIGVVRARGHPCVFYHPV